VTVLRTMSNQRTIALFGWSILVALTLLMMLNAVLLYALIGDTALERTTAIVFAGLGMLAFAVAFRGLKRASEWSWKTMWLVVGLLAVATWLMMAKPALSL
jgi:peptidoglycan/LPS O-acetylase OafA/YrhL